MDTDAGRIIMIIMLVVLTGAMLFALIRTIIGPRRADRIMGINMIGSLSTAAIAVLAVELEEPWLLDVCLVYCLMSFLAVVVLAKLQISEKNHDVRDKRSAAQALQNVEAAADADEDVKASDVADAIEVVRSTGVNAADVVQAVQDDRVRDVRDELHAAGVSTKGGFDAAVKVLRSAASSGVTGGDVLADMRGSSAGDKENRDDGSRAGKKENRDEGSSAVDKKDRDDGSRAEQKEVRK